MTWFHGNPSETPFTMLSYGHLFMIMILVIGIVLLYLTKNQLKHKNLRKYEIGLAVTLIVFELSYHSWLLFTNQWAERHALPLELCNISLVLIVVVMLSRHKATHSIVLFIGVAGALQAILTPVLSYGFPHFRFFHFFYTHLFIIWTAVYFTVVHDYRPRFMDVIKAMIFLNVLLPGILLVNRLVDGNYWFLSEKPAGGSMLDYLGPHPWYILSLEAVAFILFIVLWIIFRKRK
ncbi:TIGR02206 family membrane protein [Alteribacter aurantiacus]|uniref:YwaF family protein n=1 Tax=Alteribacter aurantiacus TaxID=254410 RepID=UPI000401F2A3|nr:TIGR02206 family membrane protein [Alteribacter aurantiacus]